MDLQTAKVRLHRKKLQRVRNYAPTRMSVLSGLLLLFGALVAGTFANARTSKNLPQSPGYTAEVSAPLSDVLQALQEVLHDEIIHGTLIFDREPTLTGATVVDSTPLFDPWKGPGQVFYKIRANAIAPRHFRDSADQGTIAVRYIIQSVAPDRTRIHIDAVFVESTRRAVHPSDGTVESSEYKVFKEHLDTLLFNEQEAAEAERRRASAEIVKQSFLRQREDESTRLASTEASLQALEQRIDALRHQVERRVKAPGTELKTAPFRSSANVMTLAAYTEVVILIVSPHWYGIETPAGQRGWVPQDQLEPLP
jgi:hypothetical protein